MSGTDTRFKPGQSGNLKGRPKLPEDIKKIRKLTQFELERVLNQILALPKNELAKIVMSSEEPSLEQFAASVVLFGIEEGDSRRFEAILNRMVGKPKETVVVEDQVKPFVALVGRDGRVSIDDQEVSTGEVKMVGRPTCIKRLDGTTVVLGAQRIIKKQEEEGNE